ncbi:MAG: extracellular solute-binding protein [Acidobacteriota bacterium]
MRTPLNRAWPLFFIALLSLALLTTGCQQPSTTEDTAGAEATAPAEAGTLTVYSGRNESLIGPILEQFEAWSGTEVEVRYASTAELTATLLEEGDASPADVFIAQDAGALGALAASGRFVALPDDVVSTVPASFRDPENLWVGLSGRARVVTYNPDRISVDELPKTLEEVTEPRYKGRFGLAPTNASFQAHMAAYSVENGAEALATLLAGFKANEPSSYPKNTPLVEAVVNGEIDFGLTNHYYLWRALAEAPDAPGRNFTMPGSGVAGFVNLAGVGVISDHPVANKLVAYLLSEDGQRYFADETYEYPLTAEVEPSVDLAPLDEQLESQIDFAAVSDALEATLEAIVASGLLE